MGCRQTPGSASTSIREALAVIRQGQLMLQLSLSAAVLVAILKPAKKPKQQYVREQMDRQQERNQPAGAAALLRGRLYDGQSLSMVLPLSLRRSVQSQSDSSLEPAALSPLHRRTAGLCRTKSPARGHGLL